MARQTLIIMVKDPRPGRVKTRLAADIGRIDATWWFRHQVARLIRRLGRDRRWRTLLAVAPDTALVARSWPMDIPRMGQGAGDLGARMRRALIAAGPGPAVLIGGDIPGVTPAHIADAFRALGSAPVVFGPAADGGYWLVGCRGGAARKAGFLEDVRWSHEETLTDSMTSAPGVPALVSVLQDVDTGADLRALSQNARPNSR